MLVFLFLCIKGEEYDFYSGFLLLCGKFILRLNFNRSLLKIEVYINKLVMCGFIINDELS